MRLRFTAGCLTSTRKRDIDAQGRKVKLFTTDVQVSPFDVFWLRDLTR